MNAASALSNVEVTGSNLNITYVVLAVALGALGIAFALRQQVLAASDGTAKMREIAEAVQEGAAAYLARQFRTLSYFVGIVFFAFGAMCWITYTEKDLAQFLRYDRTDLQVIVDPLFTSLKRSLVSELDEKSPKEMESSQLTAKFFFDHFLSENRPLVVRSYAKNWKATA